MCSLLFEASDNLSQVTKTPSPFRVISLKSAKSQSSRVGRTVPSFRIERKSSEQSGNNLDPIWTRRTERCLIKCMTMSNYIIRPVAMHADLS